MSTHELQNEAKDEQKTPGQSHQHIMKTTGDHNSDQGCWKASNSNKDQESKLLWTMYEASQ